MKGLSAKPWPSSALTAGARQAPVSQPLEASAPSPGPPRTPNHFCDTLKWGGGGQRLRNHVNASVPLLEGEGTDYTHTEEKKSRRMYPPRSA